MNDRSDPFDLAVSRWLDGEASPDEARAVEARIAADPALAARVARLRAAGDALRDDVPAAPEGMAARVYLSVVGGHAESERFHAVARRYAAAAAVILALGVGGTLWVDVIPGLGRAAAQSATEPRGTLADLAALRQAEVSYEFLDAGPGVVPEGR
jgi:anti-sigma factor RsiW